jgi:hypothetical protein
MQWLQSFFLLCKGLKVLVWRSAYLQIIIHAASKITRLGTLKCEAAFVNVISLNSVVIAQPLAQQANQTGLR